MNKPRLRFAPSPTGHLHIGGARTALYNWLIARKTGGVFVLRVEDTDRERSAQEYVDSILKAMEWLNLGWDEGPFFQTERMEVYKSHVDQLIKEEKAYRCYCTAEELETKRKKAMVEGRKPKYDGKCRRIEPSQWEKESKPFCIRFKAPQEGSTIIQDLIHKQIEFQNSELDDLIIQRTDGTPTYNLSVVVDDVTMQITHVIRGDDHLNNTPRQRMLYEAFNYPVPAFAHVPMILGSDKTRLSKRHGATSVLAYREMGYLPDALLNYLSRLGWSFGDKEIFTREELIQNFSIEAVGKSAAVFNPEKLLWLNGLYIRQEKPENLASEVKRIFETRGIEFVSSPSAFVGDPPTQQLDQGDSRLKACGNDNRNPEEILKDAIQAAQEKSKTLVEMADLIDFLFLKEIKPEEKAQKLLEESKAKGHLKKLADELDKLESFDKSNIQSTCEKVVADLGIKLKELAQPIRAALTGKLISIGVYDIIFLLGKERSVELLRK